MRVNAILTVVILVLPHAASADCIGFFNESERGYRLRSGRLEWTEEVVSAGTTLKFKGIGSLRNKSYLTRSQSDIVYDAQNIELTAGCNLATIDLTKTR